MKGLFWSTIRSPVGRQVHPVSKVFGLDRGRPIDRYYIEHFLKAQATDIRRRVLEIGDATYTRQFGGGHVTASDVLHAQDGNAAATIVGDLPTGRGVPADAFDCVILTQTLPFVFDVKGAIATLYRALCDHGVVLATVPGISQISRYDMDRWGDFWRFTSLSARRLFSDAFGPDNVTVQTYGNVYAACAFLQGLAVEDVRASRLDHHDPDYEVIITIRAVKNGNQEP